MNRTGIAIMSALFLAGAGAASAQTAQNATLKAPAARQQITPVPCSTVSFCNQVIAYCAEKGGRWVEQTHDGQGRPSSGTCYVR